MAPELALAYNSNSGDGPLGRGFSLDGITRITRCRNTWVLDGKAQAVTFKTGNDGDRYCLNGNRLVLTGGPRGTKTEYGDPLSEYAILGEPGTKIVKNEWGDFVLYAKNGTISTFLGRTQHRFLEDGQGYDLVVYQWLLTSTRDRYNNYIHYKYDFVEMPPSNGDAYRDEVTLSSIQYGQNSSGGLPDDRQIFFDYENRPDQRSQYVGGVGFLQSKRLHQIRSLLANSKSLKTYKLSYSTSPGSGRTLLTGIQECDSTICKMKTKFTWTNGDAYQNPSIEISASIAMDSSCRYSVCQRALQVADVDGDGRDDIIIPAGKIIKADGTIDQQVPSSSIWLDMNGDGRAEETPVAQGDRYFDQDGDGLPEKVSVPNNSDGTYATYEVMDVYGAGKEEFVKNTSGQNWILGDFNGDGLMDKLNGCGFDADDVLRCRLEINTGNGFLPQVWDIANSGIPYFYGGLSQNAIKVIDYDSDGRDDLLIDGYSARCNGGYYPCPELPHLILLSGGSSDKGFRRLQDGTINDKSQTLVLDWNGDGYPDIAEIADPSTFSSNWIGGNTIATVKVHAKNRRPLDLLTSVDDAFGKYDRFYYGSIQTLMGTHYKCTKTYAFPNSCWKRGMWVATAHYMDPSGDVYPGFAPETPLADIITYEDAIKDAHSGFIGFQKIVTTRIVIPGSGTYVDNNGVFVDPTHLLEHSPTTTIEFDNTSTIGTLHPYAGKEQASSVLTPLDDSRRHLESTATEWGYFDLGQGQYFVHPKRIVQSKAEDRLESVAPVEYEEREALFSYDKYGNITSASTRIYPWDPNAQVFTAPFVNEVESKYDNFEGSWLVALERKRTERHLDPDSLSQTSTIERDYDVNGSVTAIRIAPEKHGANDGSDYERQTILSRDKYGQVIQVDDSASGQVRTWTQDYGPEHIFPVYTHDPLGHTVQTQFHSGLGLLLWQSDANGIETAYSYDGFGRLRNVANQDGSATNYSYSGNFWGTDLPIINPKVVASQTNGALEETVFDRMGRVKEKSWLGFDGSKMHQHQLIDPVQRKITRFRPHLASGADPAPETEYYDLLNRPLRLVREDGTERQQFYDDATVFWTFEDGGASGQWTYTETRAGRVVTKMRITDSGYLKTRYEYGPRGALKTITDPNGNLTNIAYDDLGRRRSLRDPSAGLQTTEYNGYGEVTEQNGAEQEVRYQRDLLGRIVEVGAGPPDSAWPSHIATYVWDAAPHAIGKLVSAKSEDGIAVSFSYDSLGREDGEQWKDENGSTYSTGYSYDSIGRLKKIIYPSMPSCPSLALENQYNAYGYLGSLVQDSYAGGLGGRVFWKANSRNPRGQLLSETFANGVEAVRTYYDEAYGREKTETWVKSTGTVPGIRLSLKYEFDRFGNLSQEVSSRDTDDAVDDAVYGYDLANRLTSWQYGGFMGQKVDTFEYDSADNLLVHQRHQGSAAGWVEWEANSNFDNASHANAPVSTNYLSVDKLGRRSSERHRYEYDGSGNRVSDSVESGLLSLLGSNTSILYNWYNLPVRITTASGDWSYRYDPFHMRAKKTGPNGSVSYVGKLFEYNSQTEKFALHVYGPDNEVVQLVGDNVGEKRCALNAYYLGFKRKGSLALVMEESSAVLEYLSYSPYGETSISSSCFNRDDITKKYQGQELDEETGFVNMNGRIYDPKTAVFLSPDPADVSFKTSVNRYAFARNNPLRFRDPSGFQSQNADGSWDAGGISATFTPSYTSSDTSPDYGPPASHADGATPAQSSGGGAPASSHPGNYGGPATPSGGATQSGGCYGSPSASSSMPGGQSAISTSDPSLHWGNRIGAYERAAVRAMGSSLGISPNDLMDVMAVETGGLFGTGLHRNKTVGLLSFTPATAKAMGTSPSELANMNFLQQLGYVAVFLTSDGRFFKKTVDVSGNMTKTSRLTTLGELYTAIFFPAAVGKADSYVAVTKKGDPSTYRNNESLDANHDGVITKAEIVARAHQAALEGALNDQYTPLRLLPTQEIFVDFSEAPWFLDLYDAGP